MRFQQLVFRTTPHSLVEWLDGELEKRSIDCVYTHCILSILQEDSVDTEPDEFFDVRNNQQKVYHKYGGPESLFSVTKSKHQKWKTYSKQILLTSSISCCDIGISDLERKNRNAAINCLKSVSDDNTIEDLIEEVCLKLKNLKNVNAIENKDSVKNSNYIERDTAFYIPPSSPTDQVEKYFAAFPPLNNNLEEKYLSNEFIHVNAWYNNCLRKNKNIVQDIFKNSQISSENSRGKNDTFSSLKSIENIYQPDNKNLNRCKIHNTHKQDNCNLKFSDENSFSETSVNSKLVDVNNSTLTNMLSKFRKESPNETPKKPKPLTCLGLSDLHCKNCNFRPSCKCEVLLHNCKNEEIDKSIFESPDITCEIGTPLNLKPCSCLKSKNKKRSQSISSDLCHQKSVIEEFPKPVASSTENSENVKNQECLSSRRKKFTPCKKAKYSKNSDTFVNTKEFFDNESIDSISENVNVKSYAENENASFNKAVTFPKSKHKKKSFSKDSCNTARNDLNQLMSSNVEKISNDKEKEFNFSEVAEKNTTDKMTKIAVGQLKTNSKDNCSTARNDLNQLMSSNVGKTSNDKEKAFNFSEVAKKNTTDKMTKVAVKQLKTNTKDNCSTARNDLNQLMSSNVEKTSNDKEKAFHFSEVAKKNTKDKMTEVDVEQLKSNTKDSCSTARNDLNQLMSSNVEKVSGNTEKKMYFSEVPKKSTTDKLPKIAVRQLKKQKAKPRLKKCSIEQKNLEFLKPSKIVKFSDVTLKDGDVTKSLSSKKDHIFNKEGLDGTEKEVSVTKVQLNVKDSLEFIGNDCKETLNVSKCNTEEEIYLHKHSLGESNLYVSGDTEVEVSSVKISHNKSKTIQINDTFIVKAIKSNSEINCSPASNGSLEESNLYVSGDTEVEVSSVKNSHNKSKTIQINEDTLIVKTIKSNSELNCLPASNEIPQHKLIFPFEKINLIKIDSNIYYNFDPLRALSFFSEDEIFNIFTTGDINEVHDFLSKFSISYNRLVDEAQRIDTESKQEASNYFVPSQEMLTNYDNFDSRKNVDGEPLLRITPSCSMSEIYCSKLPLSFSLKAIKSKESGDVCSLPNKYCDEITFKSTNLQEKITDDNASLKGLDSEYLFNNDFSDKISKNRSCFSQNSYLNVAYPSFSVSDSVTGKSISGGHSNKKTCDEDIFYSPKETIVKTISDAKAGSAFKPACKVKQNYMPASSSKDSQRILKNAINIDRIIQKIIGKNRVASFEQWQNLSFFEHPNIYGQIPSSSNSVSSLDLSFNYSDLKVRTENFMSTDSDWSKQFLMNKESLKSIWEPNMNIDRIWRSPTEDEKKRNESVSSYLKRDKFHEEFEKEQEKLLRSLFSMLHLNEETEETYSYEQNVSNPVYECPYKKNTDLTEESLNTDKYSRICHTLPAQTISKFSKGNNNLSFSFSEPSVDSVGSFSLDNCKSNAVNSQISCSDNFPNFIKNESYQESDFIDLSAFEDPYGSFSENRSNTLECGGWSLDSDSYLLESDGIQDQSSSLQDLNSTGTENDPFLYMPIDRQQFSFEDDEITKLNETRWPTGFMRRRMKHKCPPFKRPCAFYMEGHCNRPDCKFSHDLSNITCRFWQEGSCFKGSTCPFLHGYAEELKTDQHRSFQKHEPEYNYSLDSESDFPSLSPSKTEKPVVAKSQPVDIIRAKGFKNSRQTNH